MKRKNVLLSAIIFSLGITASFAQRQSIGGYNVYFGTLHNHSNVSDGMGTPYEAYKYASKRGGLDFFSLADHDLWIEPSEWEAMKVAADEFNQDGVFTTFRGFEWSSAMGHVAIINSDAYCSFKVSPENSFQGLLEWVSTQECVAFLNHPGREDGGHNEFDHFMGKPSDRIVGMELWNGIYEFSRYYYNDGYFRDDNRNSFFDEANSRGWMLGAAGSEDNHRGDHGNYTQKRLAILADTLTRGALYEALKSRRFYSTLDKSLTLSFKVGGNEMGSVIESSTYNFQISAHDWENELFTQVQIYKNGSVLEEWHMYIPDISINGVLDTSNGDYFYVKVTQSDGDEAISSPVFIRK